jgi:dihydroflavonol-4-reductase
MAQICVTGGTGFIGGALVRTLLDRGHQVRVMARQPESYAALCLETIGAEIVAGDLLNPSVMPGVLEGCEGLFHLAAMFEIGARKRARMYSVNVEGTGALLNASRAAGVERIVHVSTVLALGPTGSGPQPVIPESPDPLESHPRETFTGPFEETKHLAQRVALSHARQGANIVVVCPGTVLGKGDHSEIGTALRLNMQGRLPFLMGANSCFSFVGLQDVVEGLILAYEKGQPGAVYPLVSETLTLGDLSRLAAGIAGVSPPHRDLPRAVARIGLPLVNLLARVSGGRRIYSREAHAILECNWGYDASITKRELGWECRPIATVLKQLAATITEQ